jgi:glycosyltransferase involved in cell wall biosynthesis
LSSQLGVERDCHFEPATTQVAEWLSGIDIFVLPSRSEALSNALMEAMACRCCPIASRVGGNPELVDHARNGLLFRVDDVAELASQLRELLTDDDRRKRFAAAASETIRSRFTFAQAASAMQEIYESVVSV